MSATVVDVDHDRSGRRAAGYSPLAIGAIASMGAGAIHAAAIGVHSEHRQAVIAFAALALLQIGWGAVALVRSGRVLAVAGVVINGGAFGGWILAKTSGISFVDGLEVAEGVQFADGVAATLAVVAVVVALRGLLVRTMAADRSEAVPPRRTLLGVLGAGMTVVALTGMVAAGSHSHAGGHTHGTGEVAAGHTHAGGAVDASGAAHTHTATVLPTKVYDPTQPIDLSGVPGVTPEEQARAENLVAITLIRLPHFADYRVAEAEGYHSIGDAYTGHEHFIKWDTIDDDHVLDPDHPESLVYVPGPNGSRTLVSAMFMLREGTTLDDVPDVGGALTQWHIHDNLCFSNDPTAPVVAGLRPSGGDCPGDLQAFTPVPMLHVWITKNPCGPFAALEGIGAGQIKAGETRLCDHVHGGT
ncbi:hypothetical protein [Aquihabitans sp. McL0605]|uniref:hypothetical protein n=1 Tax=Aquihabitans sp. McL0605 TaxID=3415671 RepID=UPI003CED3029